MINGRGPYEQNFENHVVRSVVPGFATLLPPIVKHQPVHVLLQFRVRRPVPNANRCSEWVALCCPAGRRFNRRQPGRNPSRQSGFKLVVVVNVRHVLCYLRVGNLASVYAHIVDRII